VDRIVKGRQKQKFTADQVKKLIDQGPFTAKKAQELGLVDSVAYPDAFEESFKGLLKAEQVSVVKNYAKAKAEELDLSNPFALFKLLAPAKTTSSLKSKVAVIYATGAIVTGKGGMSLLYYISMAAQKIYAEPGTLTGSIGVIGGKLAIKGVFDKVGITTDTITRGANAGLLTSVEPFSKSQKEALGILMKDVYDQFLDKALEGRKKAGVEMTRDQLVKLAGGRVWTGRQALHHKLIDELGTLDDAIAAAWKAAGQPADKEPDLLILPKSKGILDTLMDATDKDARIQAPAASALLREFPEISRKLQAVRPLLELRGEPVWTVLPFHLEIR
jgi:protease-4